jgi:hypothetical protein
MVNLFEIWLRKDTKQTTGNISESKRWFWIALHTLKLEGASRQPCSHNLDNDWLVYGLKRTHSILWTIDKHH